MNLPTLALLGGLAYALRWIVRSAPQAGVAIGLALLGGAGYAVASLEPGAFRTEGSPAGAVIAVVYLGAIFGAGVIGLALFAVSVRNWMRPPAEPRSRAQHARVARGLPADPVLPPDLSHCAIWLTADACARGAVAQARQADQRSRRAILVAQDTRYLALLRACIATEQVPVLAAAEFHLPRAREIAQSLAVVDVLLVGISRQQAAQRALLDLLAKQTTRFEVRHCLSLDDLQRAGVPVGRARTAAAALRLPPDAPLTHPMPRAALEDAHRRALRG